LPFDPVDVPETEGVQEDEVVVAEEEALDTNPGILRWMSPEEFLEIDAEGDPTPVVAVAEGEDPPPPFPFIPQASRYRFFGGSFGVDEVLFPPFPLLFDPLAALTGDPTDFAGATIASRSPPV